MPELTDRADLPTPILIRPATCADRPLLERLWLLFRHDMSAVTPTLPNPDGSFRSERLEAALSESGWQAWLLMLGDRPGGFAIVRGLDQPVRVLNSFFVVAGARGHRLGFDFARAVLQEHPGRWDIAYQDRNAVAVGLWPAVAGSLDASYTVERRAVPGMADAPPDVWASLTV